MAFRSAFAPAIAAFVVSSVIAAAQTRPLDPDWVAPDHEAARINPLQTAPELTAGGAKIFSQRCTECHGEAGRGTADAPDLGSPEVQAQSDGALFWKISSGNTHDGMPSFSFLPVPQRWQLVLHLRTLPADAREARHGTVCGAT